ncbi:Vps51p ASCRUDRAFT_77568 [Ascoidea rubescens DSM 1968]|uniref:Uncharacterized protein n=1 Tax=Ascoidea rubescens DSM 1968 TaxID=1344418 RepID=A0A1D2VBK5_9ASCO|nr:hypothetical protein ASCRUDRAFT_77568 [Ascoidea rubescens DSM 1968]ODV58837.1 hypothetical protein ASCRUDRAFT_77568 [Ascoidea rubescens DSM 1968]
MSNRNSLSAQSASSNSRYAPSSTASSTSNSNSNIISYKKSAKVKSSLNENRRKALKDFYKLNQTQNNKSNINKIDNLEKLDNVDKNLVSASNTSATDSNIDYNNLETIDLEKEEDLNEILKNASIKDLIKFENELNYKINMSKSLIKNIIYNNYFELIKINKFLINLVNNNNENNNNSINKFNTDATNFNLSVTSLNFIKTSNDFNNDDHNTSKENRSKFAVSKDINNLDPNDIINNLDLLRESISDLKRNSLELSNIVYIDPINFNDPNLKISNQVTNLLSIQNNDPTSFIVPAKSSSANQIKNSNMGSNKIISNFSNSSKIDLANKNGMNTINNTGNSNNAISGNTNHKSHKNSKANNMNNKNSNKNGSFDEDDWELLKMNFLKQFQSYDNKKFFQKELFKLIMIIENDKINITDQNKIDNRMEKIEKKLVLDQLKDILSKIKDDEMPI